MTTWYEDGKAITKIILKDSTGSQLNRPETTNSDSGLPEDSRRTRKLKKKKNPSKLRRDSMRRDAYVAKKTDESDVSSKAAKGNTFSSLFVTPQRRASVSRNKDIPDMVGDSPIPQLDGGENLLDQGGELNLEGDYYKIDTDEFMRQFREAMTEFELKGKNKTISDESQQNNDDQIKDAKRWALSQKKSQ